MNLISVTTDIGLHATQMDNTTPLSKKVKSWIFASSVIVDKEIKKFYNVKRRLVLQRFLIIYCVEKKKNEYQIVISPLIMQTNCSKLTCSKTRSYSNII